MFLIPELTTIIFHYLDDPLSLSHVCRYWRAIVLNNPSLWSHLRLRVRPEWRHLKSQIIFWFQHAQNIPVSVTIHPAPLHNLLLPTIIVLHTLRPYLDNISSLELHHVDHAILPHLFPPATTTFMTALTHFSLQHSAQPLHDLQDIGRVYSPNLRSLRVSDPSPLTRIFVHTIALSRVKITHCETWDTPSRVSEFLDFCPVIDNLSITFPRVISRTATVALPAVTCLVLKWHYPCAPAPLFHTIIAPHLRCLTLSHTNFLTPFPPDTINSLLFLIDSSSLVSLTFLGCNLDSMCQHLSTFCHYARALEALTIRDCHGTTDLLSSLLPSDADRTWPCPKLTSLSLGGLHDADLRHVVVFVRERMAPIQVQDEPTLAYIRSLELHNKLHDFTPQGRLILLRGLDIIRSSVSITGPLADALSPHLLEAPPLK